MAHRLDESQVAYRVLLEFITQVNGSYNDGGTTLTNSTCVCSIMDNTLGYELSNGGSIPSRRTNFSPCILSGRGPVL